MYVYEYAYMYVCACLNVQTVWRGRLHSRVPCLVGEIAGQGRSQLHNMRTFSELCGVTAQRYNCASHCLMPLCFFTHLPMLSFQDCFLQATHGSTQPEARSTLLLHPTFLALAASFHFSTRCFNLSLPSNLRHSFLSFLQGQVLVDSI